MAAESIEVRARTKEDAIRQALEQLGVSRDEVEVEVLEEGRSGVFGVGSQDARVRVTVLEEYLDADEPEDESPQPFTRDQQEPEDEDGGDEDLGDEEDEDDGEEPEAQPRFSDEDTETARGTLEQMLDLLEFPNVVTVSGVDRDGNTTNIHLDVAAEEVGLMIGRRGETLANLQFLLNACLSSTLGRSIRVIVDIEHYRDRREQSLRGIALRAADQVRRERQPVTLEPMPPNERRIIHVALQASPYVATESTGEGPERRVIISPKTASSGRRPSNGYRRG
ncbi:MAG: protein jag [Chloroflexi bacterium]|nr:protein jag [Chloroflexota bacterium]